MLSYTPVSRDDSVSSAGVILRNAVSAASQPPPPLRKKASANACTAFSAESMLLPLSSYCRAISRYQTAFL